MLYIIIKKYGLLEVKVLLYGILTSPFNNLFLLQFLENKEKLNLLKIKLILKKNLKNKISYKTNKVDIEKS
jgi:hypothetical protein